MENNEKLEVEREVSMAEALLDPTNKDSIILYDGEGKGEVFHQVAITNVEGALYAILKPETPLEGMGDDEALVFAFEQNDEGELSLLLVTDGDLVDAVFEDYYNLLREAGIEVD